MYLLPLVAFLSWCCLFLTMLPNCCRLNSQLTFLLLWVVNVVPIVSLHLFFTEVLLKHQGNCWLDFLHIFLSLLIYVSFSSDWVATVVMMYEETSGVCSSSTGNLSSIFCFLWNWYKTLIPFLVLLGKHWSFCIHYWFGLMNNLQSWWTNWCISSLFLVISFVS